MDKLERIVQKLSSAVGMRKRILKKNLSYPIPYDRSDVSRYSFAMGVRHSLREFLESMQVLENIICELKKIVEDGEN